MQDPNIKTKVEYFFISYQATNKQGTVSIWNQVIDTSPMDFIKKVAKAEMDGSNTYNSFVVVNTCNITEDQFNQYNGHF